jgi:nucleotide-binding universal stress UspA family protein
VTDEAAFELGTDGPSVILVGLDGSDTSLRATAYATGLARRQGSRLVLVYVASYSGMSGFAPGYLNVLQESQQETADELRDEIQQIVTSRGVHSEFRTEQGDPYSELTRIADEVQADAVVVGASTHAGHRLIGSLAGRLVKAGHWPVTVVP